MPRVTQEHPILGGLEGCESSVTHVTRKNIYIYIEKIKIKNEIYYFFSFYIGNIKIGVTVLQQPTNSIKSLLCRVTPLVLQGVISVTF